MTDGYPKSINDQIAGYESEIIETFDIKINNVLILAGSDVLDYMLFTYDNFCTRTPLYRLWQKYVTVHHPDFAKAYTAWTSNYEPLQNYDSTETYLHLYDDGTDTTRITHGKVNIVSAALGATAPTTSNYITTDDSATPRLESQTTQSGTTTDSESGTTTTTIEHTPTTATIDGETYSADKIESETRKKSGNIGVTTSQQMLQSEVDLRLNPLIMQYIDNFMRDYTYYVSGEWCSNDS